MAQNEYHSQKYPTCVTMSMGKEGQFFGGSSAAMVGRDGGGVVGMRGAVIGANLRTLLANSNTGRTGTHLMTCNIFCTFCLIIERAGSQVEDVKLHKSS